MSVRRGATVLIALLLAAAAQVAQPVRAPLRLTNPVQDKNFYALSLLERNPAALKDMTLDTVRAEKVVALHRAVNSCALDVNCFAEAMRFSDAEIALIATVLRRLPLDDRALRASGTEILHPTSEAAW